MSMTNTETSLAYHTTCLICNSIELSRLSGDYKRKGLCKCGKCGFVFMERIPTRDELNNHYSQYSYSSEGYLSPLTIESYDHLLDEFEKYRATNRIMDVGCGRGWFLEQAKKRGWEVVGTEYSETAVSLCESKGIHTKLGKLDPASFERGDFDVITSFEVIEHINNPKEELTNIKKLLRSGGLFYCTTPNFNSLNRYYLKAEYNIIEYPEHLSYYTAKTLNDVARKNGLKPIKTLTTGISITRIKTSQNTGSEALISKESSDERIRQRISSNLLLKVSKKIINRLLSITRTGMTLKGYYVKP